MKLMTGNSNLPLARAISDYLEVPLTEALVRRFADEEIFVEIMENVRGEDVFVVQSTSYPVNDNLMEQLIMVDALKRASAKRITAVLPYFGYARQDRKPGPRTPISAKLVANLVTTAGADRVLSVDLHAGQIQGFFDIPTDNLIATPVMAADIKERHDGDAAAEGRPRGARPLLSGDVPAGHHNAPRNESTPASGIASDPSRSRESRSAATRMIVEVNEVRGS